MGEARRKLVAAQGNGQTGYLIKRKRIRVVHNIRIQNVDSDGVMMVMLGDKEPELACPHNPAEARKLAAALIQHADALDHPQAIDTPCLAGPHMKSAHRSPLYANCPG